MKKKGILLEYDKYFKYSQKKYMHCNNCGNENTRVLDSRSSENGSVIRRRRLCENCGNRFTTYEKIEVFSIIVEKSMNRKEKYEKEKLQDSIIKATNKRNISILEINEIITRLENNWSKKSEITSKEIGKDVLDELKQLDEVSYIRYASVHLNFETSRDFINFIQDNLNSK
ncbi:transcriptional repressor NrdR [Candidatus Gracilibacteria bacterium]|nr:MAG: transcriptional repressor NrdR [Candidatus Gracilibacteria bacterium]